MGLGTPRLMDQPANLCINHNTTLPSMSHWWESMLLMMNTPKKAMVTLLLMVTWEIWKERNGRIFRSAFTSPMSLTKLKEEARLWVLTGADRLGSLLPTS